MTEVFENQDKADPDTPKKPDTDFTDYFCPYCQHKLFRGNVSVFNMVCPNCNKLVRSTDNTSSEKGENLESEDSKD